ncbi:MAG: ABC transporter substrate-binding protein [Janthinobacterium lividum]
MRALLLVPAVAVAVAACSGSGSGDGGATLRMDVVGDPYADGSAAHRTIVAATQQGLVTFDAAGQVVPGLATSWRISDDGLSVIFRLRPARWTDGRAVTANDVVAVFRRVIAPGSRNPMKPYLASLEHGAAILAGTSPATALGVEAPVDNVVEIRLAGAMPELLQLLAQPELAIVRAGPRPPAIGPFRLGDAGVRPIPLRRSPTYHAATDVTLGGVDLLPVDDPGAAIARFARDRTDVVTGSGLAGFGDARLLAASQALRVEPEWGVYGYLVNVRRGPLADPAVRRALAMAIDRDDLGSRLFGVALAPVVGLVPPGLPSERTPAEPGWAIQPPAVRLDLARQLLATAGFTAANPLALVVSLPTGREHMLVAAEVAADWARLGVKISIAQRSPAAHALAVAMGDYDLALVERSVAVDSPLFFLVPFTCAMATPAGPCSTADDALLAVATATADPARRAAALALAEAAMVADTPMIALFAPVRWSLVARRVTGWTDNAAGQHPPGRLGVAVGQEVRRR